MKADRYHPDGVARVRVERLRYLDAAVRTGSFRAAAHEVGISQPALSAQIQQLEEELDVVLLARNRRGVVATPAARALLPAIRALIAAEDELHDDARAIRGEYGGTVQIGCVPAVTPLIAPVFAVLLRDHHRLAFAVREGSSAQIERDVLGGRLDFGVVTQATKGAPAGASRTRLFDVDLFAVVPEGSDLADRSSLRWHDLEGRPIVSMQRGTTLWDVLHANVARPHVVVEASTAASARTMVASGAGVAVLAPVQHDDRDVGPVRWVPIEGGERVVQVCLVQPEGTMMSRSAAIVRRLVAERAVAEGRLASG